MAFVIVNADPTAGEGLYLAAFDPDYRPDGRAVYPCGLAEWTDDPAAALTFDTPTAAWELWRATSTAVPVRPDGLPNRPLTAYTIGIEKAP